MKVAAVMSDLMLFSRIESADTAAGARLGRVDTPTQLPAADAIHLVLVDWFVRRPDWPDALAACRGGHGRPVVSRGETTAVGVESPVRRVLTG